MNDLRMELRFKNATLYHAIFDNYASVAAFCKKHALSESNVGSLLSMKKAPLNKDGLPNKLALKLSEIFNIDFGILFPLLIYQDRFSKTAIAEVDSDLISLSDPCARGYLTAHEGEKAIEYLELSEKISKALHLCTVREEKVLRMRFFEDMSLKEIGKQLNVTRERVRQIETEAFRRLRRLKSTKEIGDIRDIRVSELPSFFNQ